MRVNIFIKIIGELFIYNLITIIFIFPFVISLLWGIINPNVFALVMIIFTSVLLIPSLITLSQCLWSLETNLEKGYFKKYIHCYKISFKKNFIVSFFYTTFLFVLVFNKIYLISHPVLSDVFDFPLSILIVIYMFTFPTLILIVSRFENKLWNHLFNIGIYSVKYFFIAIINFLIVLIIVWATFIKPIPIIILVNASLAIYLVLLNSRKSIILLEKGESNHD